ncbi:alkaline phosphatase [Meiothermus granaticius]|uniref:Alkaline phosphatase n=1 Tax=Meiothermus granaticius NBRC 107808 TaxID=1227551 RepID=A0A399FBV5_9DEIN|nr:alkaline phosphatase [Meiothermus granaticius]RIH92161.1 Alkaline phosphatase [Meiothermus granaticius NBRC 107808]GEM86564.1 alkaline phosphatase [Meiothermus granaticius NBRC 107808]
MKRGLLALSTLSLALGSAWAAKIAIYPYDGASVLAGQRFDLRVEASELQGSPSTYRITLDGQPLSGFQQTSQGPGQAEWTLRDTFIRVGEHTLEVSVTDGTGESKRSAKWVARANPRLPRAPKNIILFIGDGMGWNTLNAARIIAKGFNPQNGMPSGNLEIETGYGGMATVTNSSFDSFIVDSANSASSIMTGQKVQVNALNVYPSNLKDTLAYPRIETLAEMMKRVRGASIGVVTTTFGTDATPAMVNAHTRRRSDYQGIADQYFGRGGFGIPLDVMLFGGSRDFIPQSNPGSRRKDNTDWIAESQKLGYTFVSNRTELMAAQPSDKLFGLFNLDNFPSYLDRAVWKRPEMLGSFTDMPYLWEMTQKAVETLSKNDKGFFLMVEAGMVDKYEHPLDWQRGLWDVLELDRTVQWAKNYAAQNPDTLVIVTADHAHSISVFGGYDYSKQGRQGVGVYQDAKFPTYGDRRDTNGFPLPETARGIAVGFGATPDYCETYRGREVYKDPTISDGKGGYVANPEVCKEPGAFLRVGNLDPASAQGVHTADPMPLFAFGTGSQLFNGLIDQTEIFFRMAQALGLNPYLEKP